MSDELIETYQREEETSFPKIKENSLEGGIYVFRLSVRVQIKRSSNRKEAQSHDNSYYREYTCHD